MGGERERERVTFCRSLSFTHPITHSIFQNISVSHDWLRLIRGSVFHTRRRALQRLEMWWAGCLNVSVGKQYQFVISTWLFCLCSLLSVCLSLSRSLLLKMKYGYRVWIERSKFQQTGRPDAWIKPMRQNSDWERKGEKELNSRSLSCFRGRKAVRAPTWQLMNNSGQGEMGM